MTSNKLLKTIHAGVNLYSPPLALTDVGLFLFDIYFSRHRHLKPRSS